MTEMAAGTGEAPEDPADAFVALGANLGQPLLALRQATAAIARLPLSRLTAASAIYRTQPVDAVGPDYFNAVVRLQTQLAPHDLLQHLLAIEQVHGRLRPHRNAPRTLDLDLLLHGNTRLQTAALTLPHPRMHLRAFVLVPLLDVWPDAFIEGHGRAQAALDGLEPQAVARLVEPLQP